MKRTDEELHGLSKEELVQEVLDLRTAIRVHRDTSGQELHWHHPQLWGVLPESGDPLPEVPAWPQFIRGCVQYRQSLDEQGTNRRRVQRLAPGTRAAIGTMTGSA